MPSFDITYKWNAGESFREQSIIGTYDLKDVKLEKRIQGNIPIERLTWQIGVIVGSSGKGKTSIAKNCWPEAYYADLKERYKASCFLNDFPEGLSVKEIGAALSSTGFSEPPAWLKSYSVLSQGQKMRVDIAHALLLPQKLVVFDEFTSVIDREVAKIGSYAISKAIRRHPDKQFIAVSCHFDILDWLEPDWVYNVDTAEFTDYTNLKKKRKHPRIIVTVHKCNLSMWAAFREHHYLNTERLGAGVRCYVAKYNDKPIAFCSVACVHFKAYYYRIGRIVVLPDYQGIGVCKRLMSFMGQYYFQQRDRPFYIVTTNPQIVHGHGPDWIVKRHGHVMGGGNDSRINREIKSSLSKNRLTATLQYNPERSG